MVRVGLIVLSLLLLAACGTSPAPEQEGGKVAAGCGTSAPLRAPLLGAFDLDTLIGAHDVLLVDVRPDSVYASGHIAGAVQVWRPDYASAKYPYGGMALERDALASLMDSLGAGPETHVVAYDGKNGCDAARLWWLLKRYGHDRVWVLEDCAAGYARKRGKSLEVGLPAAPVAGGFTFTRDEDPSWVISKEALHAALGDPSTLIIDTRSKEEYRGDYTKKGAARPGHIPGALFWDWNYALQSDTSATVWPTSVMLGQLEARDIRDLDAYDRVVVYCHSGVRSAHTTLVLRELLGHQHVTNYDGSWTEWSHHPDLPAATVEKQQ